MSNHEWSRRFCPNQYRYLRCPAHFALRDRRGRLSTTGVSASSPGTDDCRGQGGSDWALLHASLLQAPLDLDRLNGLVALAGDSACTHTQRLSVPGLARHSGKVRGERARFPAVCALNRVSSPCSSMPVGRLPGMNPPMLAPRHPHLGRSSAPTKVVRRRSLNGHVVVDRVRHSEDPRRHASRGLAHRQSTCCPVYCVLECP